MKDMILGIAMIITAVLMEFFWTLTASDVLAVFALVAALISAGALARAIRLDYASSNSSIRRFLTVTGLER